MEILLTFILPSVVISEAKMKVTFAINEKRLQHKLKQSTATSDTVKLILPSLVVVAGAGIKHKSVIKVKKIIT